MAELAKGVCKHFLTVAGLLEEVHDSHDIVLHRVVSIWISSFTYSPILYLARGRFARSSYLGLAAKLLLLRQLSDPPCPK